MPSKNTLEQIVNISRDIYKTCSLTDSFLEIAGNKLVVNSIWSQLDLEKNERTKFQKAHLFDIDSNSNLIHLHTSKPQPIRNDIWNVKSPNNLMNAILTNWKDNGEDKQFLELWQEETRIQNVNLTKLDKHSKVYENSSCLGSLVWSSDSTKIAYVAEIKNTNKEKSFFTSKLANNKDSNKSNEDDLMNEENYENKYAHYYSDDWGEQYVGKSKSTIALYDTVSNELTVLDNLPEDYSPANITWNENYGLVFNAYYTKPYKLGLIYCPIRRSELFYYDLTEKKCTQLTDFKNENVRDPRFSYNFEHLIWLQNQARGPHFQCSKIMIMNWKTKEVKTLIDIVRQPKNDDDFPGIFSLGFPSHNCWSLDNKRIVLDTQWHGKNRIISIDIENKTVTQLNNEINALNSTTVLKMKDDWITGVLQGYTNSPSLIIGKLPERGNESSLKWHLTKKTDNLSELADVQLIKFKPTIPDEKYPNLSFQSIFIQAKKSNDTLILFNHGGPHSAFGCEFSAHIVIMFSLGYSILLTNYRGSIGFGQDSVDSLPGKIGTNDVNDCQQSAGFIKSKYNFKNVVVTGGSHGGFLTTQLIGQFPDFYQAAAARNPVTHLESMLYLSDIPDWVVCEGLGQYDYDFKIGGSNNFNELFKNSPMTHINNVKTPTLLMIGKVDLRVPPSQGVEYYKALISRNVPAKLISFKEDNHPLDKPHTTADCIVHIILWFEKYIN